MKICIVGLGYIGTVSGALFADAGHQVIGVDLSKQKVDIINSGKAPIVEPGLEKIIRRVTINKSLFATTDMVAAIGETDIAFVCVGTPSRSNGDLDLGTLFGVIDQISKITQDKKKPYSLFIRSTIKPGTVASINTRLKNKYGQNNLLSINVNPEFLREGTAISDFLNPPYTVIGLSDIKTKEITEELYSFIDSEIIYTDINVGEIIKYVNNSFHALKVAFTNEVSSICQSLKIDSNVVMEIFKKDKVLNVSEYYFNPGFAYGGSCLPKDLRGLVKLGNENEIKNPILESIALSNSNQVQKLTNLMLKYRQKKIGFYGIAFKNDTDDLRESPIIEVIEYLIGKGFKVKIHDPDVELSFLQGGNLEFLNAHFSHFSDLFESDFDKFIHESQVLVVNKQFNNIEASKVEEEIVIDLNYQHLLLGKKNYFGFNW
jgi:GDP-mannose 6-dehydrogenase